LDKPDSEESRAKLLFRKASLSPAQQALLKRRVVENLKRSPEAPATSRIEPVPRDGELPLTLREESIFEECSAWADDGSNSRTNMSKFYRLSGPFDEAAMAQAVCDLARRHENLRTRFTLVDAKPTRLIEPNFSPTLPLINLEHLPENQRLETALKIASQEADRPFKLNGDWLWRIVVMRLGGEDHLLLLVVDHFIGDDWSMNLLVRDTWAFYHARATGSPAPLAELPVQFADFAYWQRHVLQGAVLDKLISYWRRQLDGIGPLPELRLPIELPAPRLSGSRPTGAISAVLPQELSDSLRALAREKNATLQATMLSSLFVLLHLYTGENDLGICRVSAKRHRPELQEVVGCFTDFEVLRATISRSDTFSDLLLRVRDAAIEALEHSDLPYSMFPGQETGCAGDSFHPSFTFNMLIREARPREPRGREDGSTLPSLSVTSMGSPSPGRPAMSQPGLRLFVAENSDSLSLILTYTIELYEVSAVREFLDHYRVIMERVAANPQLRISDLPVSIKGGPTAA
jgi:hypothetical protein